MKTGIHKYYDKGDFDKAIEYYRKSLENECYFSAHYAYYNIGLSLSALKKYDEAIEAYKKAIEIFPKDADAYNNMGVVYYNQKKYIDAIQCFKKNQKTFPLRQILQRFT